MTAALDAAGVGRRLDVCVEVGMAGGRTGCRGADAVDEVARAAAGSPRLRLVGVAGYEAMGVQDHASDAYATVRPYLAELRGAVDAVGRLFEADDVVVTAGGSSYFDAVADELTGDWPAGLRVRTICAAGAISLRRRAYRRTSPLHAPRVPARIPCVGAGGLAAGTRAGAAHHGQARRLVRRGPAGAVRAARSAVLKLNDQHAYLRRRRRSGPRRGRKLGRVGSASTAPCAPVPGVDSGVDDDLAWAT